MGGSTPSAAPTPTSVSAVRNRVTNSGLIARALWRPEMCEGPNVCAFAAAKDLAQMY